MPASQDTQALKRVITGLTVNSPGIYYLLQAPDGQVMAGNMTAIEPKPGLRSLEWPHQAPETAVDRRHKGPRRRVAGRRLFVCRHQRLPAW